MIEIINTEVTGWEHAIRGMRNPMNSWDKSDTSWFYDEDVDRKMVHIGNNDLKLMKKLSNAGNDHGKFLRMITVYCDITAPLYWWKEYDTYKVGTVANSCSTMHKIHDKELNTDDFSIDKLNYDENLIDVGGTDFTNIPTKELFDVIIEMLNELRNRFIKTKNKKYWYQMIQLLPSSYNQKRTCELNYAVLKNMYHSRKKHKLDEWREFCKWVESLPYAKELIIGE